MAQFPVMMFSTVPHISIKKPPSPPSSSSSSSSSSFYGLLSHHLSLPFCGGGGGGGERERERSAPVSTTVSSSTTQSFNKCFSLKHSPPRPPRGGSPATTPRVSTQLPLSIPESKAAATTSLEILPPPAIMELADHPNVVEDTNVRMEEDSPSVRLNTGTQSQTDKATEEAGEPNSAAAESTSGKSSSRIRCCSGMDSKTSNAEFAQVDIPEPSAFDSSTTVIHHEDIVLDDVVEDPLSDVEMNGDVKCAVTNMAKSSSVSNQEFEQYFFKLSLLYGTDLENSFKDYVTTLKKSDPMEYRSIPIKKEGQVFAVLRRSRFFVTRKIKNGAMLGIRILRRDKHKTKKKVMVCANIVDEAGKDKLWSKPILRGKRCRELSIEEYP